ncbi:hypothetical protein [Nocardioides sp. Leaf285]|uniref:hypothetical protein n=1 Tax=Nocardioides sp. Leaf285 TaxID=1736322 RepID=UPI000702B3A4|nr:hypothetical protein [Nocardioides sp. Leaf285]KQP62923.1 hypothetical protein ASF47_18090 [Nocardioides sp. Leaf285]
MTHPTTFVPDDGYPCTHPNCEQHGKSPCEGVGCDGLDDQERAALLARGLGHSPALATLGQRGTHAALEDGCGPWWMWAGDTGDGGPLHFDAPHPDPRHPMAHGHEAPVRVKVALDPAGVYWGWMDSATPGDAGDSGDPAPSMISAHRPFVACFPDSPQAMVDAGRGRVVRLSITSVPSTSVPSAAEDAGRADGSETATVVDDGEFGFPWDAILAEDLAPYPPLVEVCTVLVRASRAMERHAREHDDVRWSRMADLIEETADRIATADPFMPREQQSAEWLERNHRTVLEAARTFLGQTP